MRLTLPPHSACLAIYVVGDLIIGYLFLIVAPAFHAMEQRESVPLSSSPATGQAGGRVPPLRAERRSAAGMKRAHTFGRLRGCQRPAAASGAGRREAGASVMARTVGCSLAGGTC
jgi:hypothetical protein